MGIPADGDANDEYGLACQINDAYRVARIYMIYYGRRLERLRRQDRVVDVLVAVGTSAAVASLAVWRTDVGRVTFNLVVAVAAVLVAVKPVLNLSSAVARVAKMWSTYSGAFESLQRLQNDLLLAGRVVPGAELHLRDAQGRIAAVAGDQDACFNEAWLNEAQDAAERELPMSRLWWPAGSDLTSTAGAAGAGDAEAA